MRGALLLLLLLPLSASQRLAATTDTDVSLVIVGMRHANRNPESFCCGYEEAGLGQEGPMQLTTFGKQQAYAFGRALHSRYPQLLADGYSATDVAAFSSSAPRCQMTLQALLAGLFPPRPQWQPGLDWQPIPYTVDDRLLRMYKTSCPRSKSLWDHIGKDQTPAMSAWLRLEKQFIHFVTGKAGIKGTSKISLMADVADNIANLVTARSSTYPYQIMK